MDLIDEPTLGLNITVICFSFKMLVLIIFKSLKKNVGREFPLPKGPSLLISFIKLLFIADEDISKSYS